MDTIICNNQAKVCITHKKPVIYINLLDQTNNPFKCFKCARGKMELQDLIHINEILDEDDYDLITNFPPLEESIPIRMREASRFSNKHEEIFQTIKKYFDELQSEIESKILKVKSTTKEKEIRLLRSFEEVYNKYNDVSLRKEVRAILKGGGEDMDSQISEILQKVAQQEEIQKSSRIIGECLDENKIWKESISFIIPNKIKDAIINLIQNIDFFSGVSEQQFENVEKQSQLLRSGQVDMKNNSNCQLLMDLISSKANFCEEDFLCKTRQMIQSLSFYINSYNLGENPFKAADREAFQNLNENQMKQIVDLSKKMKEVSGSYESSNTSEEEINSLVQPKTCSLFQYQRGFLDQEQRALKLLLKQFPIIEMSPLDSFRDFSMLSQFDLIKSSYNNSQKLVITKQINGHIMVQNCEQQGYRICYSNFILDSSKQYIIRLQLSQNTNNDNNFYFGLLPDAKKDSVYLHNCNMIYFEGAGSPNKINKIVKGGQVAKGNGQPANRELEVRICLDKKIFRVSDYPNYQNICEIDDTSKMQQDITYRFAMQTYILGSRMTITEIIETSCFDKKM